jgi:large subunit ribosomal protein L19e
MDLANQKRMASEIMKCGKHRVWMDPNRLSDISEAVTRGDIRKLVVSGAIKLAPKAGMGRGRALIRKAQKAKGRRRGAAHRKGAKYARLGRKLRWIRRIRPIRARLSELRDTKAIERSVYRVLYRQAKGGMFHNRAHLDTQLKLRGILKELKIEAKQARRTEKRKKLRRAAARSIIKPSSLVKGPKKERKEKRKPGPPKLKKAGSEKKPEAEKKPESEHKEHRPEGEHKHDKKADKVAGKEV